MSHWGGWAFRVWLLAGPECFDKWFALCGRNWASIVCSDPSSLSSFSPATSRVCRIPLTSGTSFIDPESIKIAFRVRNTDGTNRWSRPRRTPPGPGLRQRPALRRHQLLRPHRGRARPAEGQRVQPQQGHGGFRRAVHQGGYADVLLRPTMVGILRCGKMLPPQLNLVIDIEFADATTALWSENAGAHPAGATLSTDFEIQNVRVLASQVVLDSALVVLF